MKNLHTYFDSIRSVLDEKKFSHRILMEYEELSSRNMVKEHQKDYKRFFIVREMPKRGRKVEYNQEAIDIHRKNSIGWPYTNWYRYSVSSFKANADCCKMSIFVMPPLVK